MIDTDKYEGHTEGEWVFKHINSNWYQCDKIGEIHMEDIAIKEASANAQLIADAPKLLQALMDERKIWIFTDEYEEEHEFTDPYEMMNYMWQHYIEDNVKIGWRKLK